MSKRTKTSQIENENNEAVLLELAAWWNCPLFGPDHMGETCACRLVGVDGYLLDNDGYLRYYSTTANETGE